MKKKIKDLTLKEFYLFITKQLEEIKPFCIGIEPINALRKISIENYIRDYGNNEVEIDESNND